MCYHLALITCNETIANLVAMDIAALHQEAQRPHLSESSLCRELEKG